MKTRTAACAALLALAALTGCSDNDAKAEPTACKSAMRKQLQDGIAAGDKATPGTRPVECLGVDDKTVQKIAGDLMAEEIGKAVDSAMPTPEVTLPDADGIQASLDAIESELDAAMSEAGMTPSP